MNHFIHIIKDIGLHMNGFASFISDAKKHCYGYIHDSIYDCIHNRYHYKWWN